MTRYEWATDRGQGGQGREGGEGGAGSANRWGLADVRDCLLIVNRYTMR